ncbi:MAE_28990/MAE_18760 family HEPN-like nuclease [Sphingobacterium sp. UDSM-2020]|uniref:MAE_28990/MAE_18760 family HEPN-like nuclease n=1 Tax=Sphingobacterium sp. UDSM-2020 TaxID=2795738 RepID=UPI0019369953|nr:MAE_28990/MAE_18760 family HEPN-like nuclease [Sphingobacterium sp. UDSM-2020]QQD14276.1 hypothetical protein JAZ75_01635 [Sphingobacterium sp. UDSM-2020]
MSKYLDEEIAWRRKELHIVKAYIPTHSNSKQNAALRFNVPILYAHFEGFVKKSTELYLEYVAGKYLKHSQLQSQFVSLSLSKKIGLLEVKNIEDKTKIIEFILSEGESKSNILTKNVIQTKSNLKYNVFKEILFTIGIEEKKFSQFESLINDLVEARNYIAHGDYLKVDLATFETMYDDIQQIMLDLKTEIENAASLESFKKTITTP